MHVLTYGYYKLIFGCLELGAAARKKRLVRSSASHQIKEKNASILWRILKKKEAA